MKRHQLDELKEWSQYFHGPQLQGVEALHARFIGHRYSRHAHDYFVIALVERGAASYWYRGTRHVAGAGQVFVLNPGESHTGDPVTPRGYVYRVLYPRLEYLDRIGADVGATSGVVFFKESVLNDSQLTACLSAFHRRLAHDGTTVECESLLLQALARLITRHADPKVTARRIGSESPAIKRARDYMEAHFAEDVSLSKLAVVVALSPYYFAHAFERETGLPPHAYLESVRIRKAREFLDQGQSLVSAALSVGYVDQSHLTHRFKRFLGITPGRYLQGSKI
jgi:AraC-like DNA-binding protein